MPGSLLTAIAASNETLNRQQQTLMQQSRDLANITAARSKQQSAKHERANSLERDVKEQRETAAALGKETRSAEDLLPASRAVLGERHTEVDLLQQKNASMSKQIVEGQRKVSSVANNLQAAVAQLRVERDRMERRASDLEKSLSQLSEGLRRLTVKAVPTEATHRERLAAKRREIGESRQRISESQKTLSSLRQLLDDNGRDMEETMRRRRKAQEEAVRDYASQRRANQLQFNSDRDERERVLRAETDASVDELRAKLDSLMSQLSLLRDEESREFQLQMQLREQCTTLNVDIVGIEALSQRASSLHEHIGTLSATTAELSSETHRLRGLVIDRSKHCNMMADAVSPLPDVEASCHALLIDVQSKTGSTADKEAEHAVWRVRESDRVAADHELLTRLRSDHEAATIQRISEVDRGREAARQFDLDTRDLLDELRNTQSKLSDMGSRNAALDQTLEHINRQRRAMAEELALRRDAARMAAANLLAQLE